MIVFPIGKGMHMKIKQTFTILLSLIFVLMLFSGCQVADSMQSIPKPEAEQMPDESVSTKQWKSIDLQIYPVDLQFTECAELTLSDNPQIPEPTEEPENPTEETTPQEIGVIPETTQATEPADIMDTNLSQFDNNAVLELGDVPALENSFACTVFRGPQYTDLAHGGVCRIQIQQKDSEQFAVLSGILCIDKKEVLWDETEKTVEDVSGGNSDGVDKPFYTEAFLKMKLEEALLGDIEWLPCTEVNTYAHNQKLTKSKVSGHVAIFTNDEQTVFQTQNYDANGMLECIVELSESNVQAMLNGTVSEIQWDEDRYAVMHLAIEEAVSQDNPEYQNQLVQSRELTQSLQQQNKKGKTIIITLGVIVMLLVSANLICIFYIFHKRKQKPLKTCAKKNTEQAITPTAMVKSIGTVHNIGGRSGQQDSFDVVNCAAGTLAVVADGMGGLSDGDKVSQKIVATMRSDSSRIRPGQTDHVLCQMVAHANQEVNRMLGAARQYKCGSTLLAVLVENNTMQWITVGDSRIYLYRGGSLIQINREHIYCTELLEKAINAKMSFMDALRDPQVDRLSSFIGMGDLKHVDICLNRLELCAGDRILLMSDGVFNTLSNAEIARVIRSSSDAAVAAARLEERVLQKNAPNQDNFTCVILEV